MHSKGLQKYSYFLIIKTLVDKFIGDLEDYKG